MLMIHVLVLLPVYGFGLNSTIRFLITKNENNPLFFNAMNQQTVLYLNKLF